MLNPIFWKKVQGQKHPGRWGIAEHQIHRIRVLFKTNSKSHKHPGIKLLSSESKTQLVNQRKQKVAFKPGTAHSPEIQSYRMWWGAASPILNVAPVLCIYMSYNRTHVENAYIYIYIHQHRASGRNKGHQEETHHPTHIFRRLFLLFLCMIFIYECVYMWSLYLCILLCDRAPWKNSVTEWFTV